MKDLSSVSCLDMFQLQPQGQSSTCHLPVISDDTDLVLQDHLTVRTLGRSDSCDSIYGQCAVNIVESKRFIPTGASRVKGKWIFCHE